MASTRANPETCINWLFFNKTAGSESQIHSLAIRGRSLALCLDSLEWTDALKRLFGFRANE